MQSHDIIIATPFRLQAAAVRRLLQQRLGAEATLPIIDTVERIQGLTVELAIYSLCASDNRFVAQTAAFLFSPQRLNVAISRARGKAIVLASPQALNIGATGADATAVALWRQLLSGAHAVTLGG
jgi:superfamily I DNA and/or RNA helicase